MIPERFCITIEGSTARVRERVRQGDHELPYLLAAMLGGDSVGRERFDRYGLRVTVEECTDQGDDASDGLATSPPYHHHPAK